MKQCPRCLRNNMEDKEVMNKLSRRDNETYICNQCGTEEALIDAKMITDKFLIGVDNNFRKKVKEKESKMGNYIYYLR